jgi:DNA/RNA-binding domain of Phe-tRNA-synthetase-like protein
VDEARELEVEVAAGWYERFPGAHVGVLALSDVTNPSSNAVLEERVEQIEASLRQRYAAQQRAQLAALPVIQAYQRHYRAFGQTYHVLRQLESVTLKGKALASPSALVLAMFAAELDSLLLTAAHDLDTVLSPIQIDTSNEGERFVGIGGRQHSLHAGDMLMRDRAGIISAVVYGPDERTRLRPETERVAFTTYAPADIDVGQIHAHLAQIAELVRLVSPAARTSLEGVYP